jgi:hypothetical protein
VVELSAGGAVGVVGVDGVAFVEGSVADCVGGAVCVAGSTTGCPIESDTVGTFAYGSFDVCDVVDEVGPAAP